MLSVLNNRVIQYIKEQAHIHVNPFGRLPLFLFILRFPLANTIFLRHAVDQPSHIHVSQSSMYSQLVVSKRLNSYDFLSDHRQNPIIDSHYCIGSIAFLSEKNNNATDQVKNWERCTLSEKDKNVKPIESFPINFEWLG